MIIDDLAIGAISGTVATGPMTLVMEGIHRVLPHHEQDPLPPRQITQKLSHHAGIARQLGEQHLFTLTILGHFLYGGATGSVYGAAARKWRLNPFAGISFGLLVWAISYLGLLPALGLYPSPRKDTGRRTAIMVLAHIVWGAMLGTTVKLLQKSGDEASSMSGVGQISRLWQR